MKLASVTANYNYIKYGFKINFKGELKNGKWQGIQGHIVGHLAKKKKHTKYKNNH